MIRAAVRLEKNGTKVRRACVLLLAIVAGTGKAVSPSVPSGADCFTKQDSRMTPYRVFQTARSPDSTGISGSASATSPYFPGTDFLTSAAPVKDLDPRYKVYLFTWINRCQYIQGETKSDDQCRVRRRSNGDAISTQKGNFYQGMTQERALGDQVRSAFTSYAAADSCTIAQEMQALGMSDAAIDERASVGGITLYRADDRSSTAMRRLTRTVLLADHTPWKYLVNLCILPSKGAARNFAGFGLDYEVNDYRTPAVANMLFQEYTRLAHAAGKRVMMAVNPLPRPASGLDASNIQPMVGLVDYFAIALSNGATPGNALVGNRPRAASGSLLSNYQQQLAELTDDGRRPLSPALKRHIVWQVPLYQVDLADAAALQAAIGREGYGGISLFRNYLKQGGSCSLQINQLTACFALGQCNGRFGADRR